MSCPGGVLLLALKSPALPDLAGPTPSKCELARNRAHSFQNGAGSGPRPLPTAASLPIVGLTVEPRNAAVRSYCSAFVLEFAVNDVVDRIFNAYQLKRPLIPGELQIQDRKLAHISKAWRQQASAIPGS